MYKRQGPVRKIITAPKPEHWLHAMHWVEVLEGGDYLAAINVAQSELSIYAVSYTHLMFLM